MDYLEQNHIRYFPLQQYHGISLLLNIVHVVGTNLADVFQKVKFHRKRFKICVVLSYSSGTTSSKPTFWFCVAGVVAARGVILAIKFRKLKLRIMTLIRPYSVHDLSWTSFCLLLCRVEHQNNICYLFVTVFH